MPGVESNPQHDAGAIRAAVVRMLTQNDWRLIEPDDLVRRVAAALAAATAQPDPASAPPAPTAEGQPAHDRPWRRRGRAGNGRAPAADLVAMTALNLYAETLYLAFADSRHEERQRRAYEELRRYTRRVAARYGSELSQDEREEVADYALTELYCRYVVGEGGRTPLAPHEHGLFIAKALYKVRNTVRLWRRRAGPWMPFASGEWAEEPERADEGPPDQDGTYDPVAQAEHKERHVQVALAFQLAVERHPHATLQLRAAWLHVFEELSYNRIAELFETTVGNVRVLTWRGLKKLQNDPGFRAFARDEELLAGLETLPRLRQSVELAREHGNE